MSVRNSLCCVYHRSPRTYACYPARVDPRRTPFRTQAKHTPTHTPNMEGFRQVSPPDPLSSIGVYLEHLLVRFHVAGVAGVGASCAGVVHPNVVRPVAEQERRVLRGGILEGQSLMRNHDGSRAGRIGTYGDEPWRQKTTSGPSKLTVAEHKMDIRWVSLAIACGR